MNNNMVVLVHDDYEHEGDEGYGDCGERSSLFWYHIEFKKQLTSHVQGTAVLFI